MVIATVGAGGRISIYNNSGSVDVVVDAFGYFSPTGDLHTAIAPNRRMDTRNGTGGFATKFGPSMTRSLTVAGVGGVPSTASAVIVNMTPVNATDVSYMTAFPTGRPRPYASNVNFIPGEVAPNLGIIPVGDGGQISFYNYRGSTDFVVDVVGYFDAAGQSLYHPIFPVRALDSRSGLGLSGPWTASATRNVVIAANVGVPTDARSVVGNLTGVNQTGNTYETLWPAGLARPNASNLNLAVGDTRANGVISGIGSTDSVSIFNRYGSTDLLLDVTGWFR